MWQFTGYAKLMDFGDLRCWSSDPTLEIAVLADVQPGGLTTLRQSRGSFEDQYIHQNLIDFSVLIS